MIVGLAAAAIGMSLLARIVALLLEIWFNFFSDHNR